ncbi:MAG TPA: hypothetical protein VIJ83_06600 [Solirubrobacteraceae bacterium]
MEKPLAPPRRRKARPPADAAPSPRAQARRAREEEARAALTPLAPGERPRPLLAAVAACTLLGGANVIAYAAGAKIDGHHPGAGVLAFTGLMALLGGGMWARRYLAVLAFEALLALVVLVFALFLVEASNIEAVALCVGIIGLGGWLFWKLVRVMGRMSAPRQPSSG